MGLALSCVSNDQSSFAERRNRSSMGVTASVLKGSDAAAVLLLKKSSSSPPPPPGGGSNTDVCQRYNPSFASCSNANPSSKLQHREKSALEFVKEVEELGDDCRPVVSKVVMIEMPTTSAEAIEDTQRTDDSGEVITSPMSVSRGTMIPIHTYKVPQVNCFKTMAIISKEECERIVDCVGRTATASGYGSYRYAKQTRESRLGLLYIRVDYFATQAFKSVVTLSLPSIFSFSFHTSRFYY